MLEGVGMSEGAVCSLIVYGWTLFGLFVLAGFRRTMGRLSSPAWVVTAILLVGPIGLVLALFALFFYVILSIPDWLAKLEEWLEHIYYCLKHKLSRREDEDG